MRIPVLSEDNSIKFWMKFNDAIEALRARTIEEVYDRRGDFIGVVLRESPIPLKESFHRGSADLSLCTLTDSDSRANAGLANIKRVKTAREKVAAWPVEHDTTSPVISAGVAFGVFCPILDHPANAERIVNFA